MNLTIRNFLIRKKLKGYFYLTNNFNYFSDSINFGKSVTTNYFTKNNRFRMQENR